MTLSRYWATAGIITYFVGCSHSCGYILEISLTVLELDTKALLSDIIHLRAAVKYSSGKKRKQGWGQRKGNGRKRRADDGSVRASIPFTCFCEFLSISMLELKVPFPQEHFQLRAVSTPHPGEGTAGPS